MFNKYPYTDFHELNADWLIEDVKDTQATVVSMTSDIEALKTAVINLQNELSGVDALIGTGVII